jgi:DNA (cytosine-5)-methyltransferase 1
VKYLSVFSGIEAATVAWEPIGFEPVGFSEIDAFPSAVLAERFPNVPNYGDVTKYKEWPIERGSVDLLVGGSPCQAFSVAGLRGGLSDPRGNLMLTYGAIAAHLRPSWIVWENVPGVLSSNGGRDFGTFLGMLAELGYGFAYRILDAQYVRVESHPRAVPQRRRRVFIVGYLGDWRRAAAVLFESESMCGYPAPSRKAGERVAPAVTQGPPFSRTGNERVEAEAMVAVAHTLKGEGFDASEDGTGRGTPLVAQSASPALRAKENTSNRLDSMAVAFTASSQANSYAWESEINPTLNAQPPNDTSNLQYGIRQGLMVRRLTPVECERLMGFPDNWTRIPWRGKPAEQCSDGPRYKAIGNSMAVNVMEWIGNRIKAVHNA